MTEAVKVSKEMLAQLTKVDPSVAMDDGQSTNLSYDLGNLAIFAPVDIDFKKVKNNVMLAELAREHTQNLYNKLFMLETEAVESGRVAHLPEPTTRLPRAKPVPKVREPTKWEQFAKLKGIKKKKKAFLVYDENHDEYRRRWGYQRANDINDQWAIDEKDIPAPGQKRRREEEVDPTVVDPWTEARRAKKARVEKNEKQRVANVRAASTGSRTPIPGAIDLGSVLGKQKPGKQNAKNKKKSGPSHLEVALATAQRATASMGKFDVARKGEPALIAPRKPRRDTQLMKHTEEHKQNTNVLKKVLGRATEKDSFSVEKAMGAIGAHDLRRGELETARATKNIGRSLAKASAEARGLVTKGKMKPMKTKGKAAKQAMKMKGKK